MVYYVIYDSNCNLCVTFTDLLVQFDQGQHFRYIPMKDEVTLTHLGIAPETCEQGVILMAENDWSQFWQGTAAIEEIINILPWGEAFIQAYRLLPGAKWLGDQTYEQVRDHRYQWFGCRRTPHQTPFPATPVGQPNQPLESKISRL